MLCVVCVHRYNPSNTHAVTSHESAILKRKRVDDRSIEKNTSEQTETIERASAADDVTKMMMIDMQTRVRQDLCSLDSRECILDKKYHRKLGMMRIRIESLEQECLHSTEACDDIRKQITCLEKKLHETNVSNAIIRIRSELLDKQYLVHDRDRKRVVGEIETLSERKDEMLDTISCTSCTTEGSFEERVERRMISSVANPVVARCPAHHGKCLECFNVCVRSFIQDPSRNVVCDFCHETFDKDEISNASKDVYGKYLAVVAKEDQKISRETHAQANQAVEGDHERMLELQLMCNFHSPCCSKILEFEGCCTVKCTHCPRHFCGWCFEVYTTDDFAKEMEDHHCPLNPDKDGCDENTKQNLLKSVWDARKLDMFRSAIDITPAKPLAYSFLEIM